VTLAPPPNVYQANNQRNDESYDAAGNQQSVNEDTAQHDGKIA
jgi:hypothetical protein